MGATTPHLNLYKPGGGSSGVIIPDERVDIDRINGNMDLLDAWATTTDSDIAGLKVPDKNVVRKLFRNPEVFSGNTDLGATDVDIPGMSATFTLTEPRDLRFYINLVTTGRSLDHVVLLRLTNGTINRDTTRMANSSPTINGTGNGQTWGVELYAVPAGTHTFKVVGRRIAGSASNVPYVSPGATSPSQFSADYIG